MLTGILVRWNDEKGFGFIRKESDKQDVFIHISALAHMSRRPVVGDVIFFDFETEANGKLRVTNAKIEGVPRIDKPQQSWSLTPIHHNSNPKPKATVPRTQRTYNNHNTRYQNERRGFFSKVAPLFIVVLAFFAYQKFSYYQKDNAPIPVISPIDKPKSVFKCTGKAHCSEMSSCEEATFYIQNCPNTKMDGDNDGIPCENQWCN
jgi:cold shock CspA family protein